MTLARQTSQQLAVRRASDGQSGFVPHLSIDEVRSLATHAESHARAGKGERDSLLIQTIFDGCFRVSEALSLTPDRLHQTQDGWCAQVVGKGGNAGQVAISASLVARLHSYAYRSGITPDQRLFPVTPARVWQIVDRAFDAAGIRKPDHVGTVHVLRHSGAIARLAATGNPKAVQDQLRHKEARMTLRYLKTLSSMESLRIQQEVEFGW